MRFLVTSLIRLGIVRINYLMVLWCTDPAVTLQTFSEALKTPCEPSHNRPYWILYESPVFSMPSPSPQKHCRAYIVLFNSNPL